MTSRRRIVQGIGANGFGQVVTIFVQLASVPILISHWGIEMYGEWLALSAIPSYLVLSDIGFTSTAGNTIALAAESRDRRQLQTIYQSTWAMVSILSAAGLSSCAVAAAMIDLEQLLRFGHIVGRDLTVSLILLLLHVVASLQTGVLQLPFRALKKNPVSVAIVNIVRLAEWGVATTTVLCGGAVVSVALSFVAVRMFGNLLLSFTARRMGSTLSIGLQDASRSTIAELFPPAMASLSFPLGLSLTMQGFVLLIGGLVGPGGVAIFSIYRTIARVPIQIVTAVNQAVWPELSYVYGARSNADVLRLVNGMFRFGLFVGVVSTIALILAGEAVIDFWTTKSLDHNWVLLVLLSITSLLHVLWQPLWVGLMAANQHSRFSARFLFASVLGLVLGAVLTARYGLSGAGLALLCVEIGSGLAALECFVRTIPKSND